MVIETDVVICGSGSAGLCAAIWLARLGIPFELLERRDGPLKTGQADGIQCRTVEIFESMGMAEELISEAYWVNEVCFWSLDPISVEENKHMTNGARKPKIVRTGRTQDVADGLSWRPHVILNQARLNGMLIEEIRRRGGKEIEYDVTVRDVIIDANVSTNPSDHAVTVKCEKNGQEIEYKAKYVLVSHLCDTCSVKTLMT